MPALLDVRGLQVDFEADTGPVRVLNGMDLTVEAGQSVGVVGESGSGKTVLLRTILGLLQDQWRVGAGAVTFDGQDLRAKTETQMNAIRGAEIALTTPEPRKHLNPLLRIGEQIVNVLRAHERIDRRAARDKAVQLLRAVGIPAPEERVFSYPHEMSGGMCQRVIIAMALAHSPRLLLADEPTAGLDVTISRQILDLMSSLIRDTRLLAAAGVPRSRRRGALLPDDRGGLCGPSGRNGAGGGLFREPGASVQSPPAARCDRRP